MNDMINLNPFLENGRFLYLWKIKPVELVKELWTLIIYVGLKACKMFLSDPRTSYNKHKHRRNEVQRSGYAEDEEKNEAGLQ